MMDLMCRTLHDFLLYTLQDCSFDICSVLHLAFDYCVIPSLLFIQLSSHNQVIE